MNIFETVLKEHAHFRQSLQTIFESEEVDFFAVRALQQNIENHAAVEEMIVYPALFMKETLREVVRDFVKEHTKNLMKIREISQVPFGGDAWRREFRMVKEQLESHMDHEDRFLMLAEKHFSNTEKHRLLLMYAKARKSTAHA